MRQKNRKFSALLSGVIIAAVSGTVFASVYSKKPLHTTNFKEILKSYTFVNDFSTKPPERSVSKEIFWKYPVTIPRLYFKINSDFDPGFFIATPLLALPLAILIVRDRALHFEHQPHECLRISGCRSHRSFMPSM